MSRDGFVKPASAGHKGGDVTLPLLLPRKQTLFPMMQVAEEAIEQLAEAQRQALEATNEAAQLRGRLATAQQEIKARAVLLQSVPMPDAWDVQMEPVRALCLGRDARQHLYLRCCSSVCTHVMALLA